MLERVEWSGSKRRVRVERGICRQAIGKYAVCFILDGRPRCRTVGYELEVARSASRVCAGGAFSVLSRPRLDCGWGRSRGVA